MVIGCLQKPLLQSELCIGYKVIMMRKGTVEDIIVSAYRVIMQLSALREFHPM